MTPKIVKAKVIVRFRDKNTKEVHNINTVYEGTEERINELVGLGFVEVIKEETKESPSVLEGNIQSIKEQLDGVDKDTLKIVLETEKEGQNRKGVIEHIESLLESE